VRLFEVEDDHSLHVSMSDGRLVEWVRELAACGGPSGDRASKT
jgi:hypothetical protein